MTDLIQKCCHCGKDFVSGYAGSVQQKKPLCSVKCKWAHEKNTLGKTPTIADPYIRSTSNGYDAVCYICKRRFFARTKRSVVGPCIDCLSMWRDTYKADGHRGLKIRRELVQKRRNEKPITYAEWLSKAYPYKELCIDRHRYVPPEQVTVPRYQQVDNTVQKQTDNTVEPDTVENMVNALFEPDSIAVVLDIMINVLKSMKNAVETYKLMEEKQ